MSFGTWCGKRHTIERMKSGMYRLRGPTFFQPIKNNNENMGISELFKRNVIVQVSAEDLKEFALTIIEGIKNDNDVKDDEPLLSTSAFCAKHGVSSTTVWRWRKDGILHPVRIGGKYFYRSSEITHKD